MPGVMLLRPAALSPPGSPLNGFIPPMPARLGIFEEMYKETAVKKNARESKINSRYPRMFLQCFDVF